MSRGAVGRGGVERVRKSKERDQMKGFEKKVPELPWAKERKMMEYNGVEKLLQ